MRREALFNRSGFYGFLLKSNVLLHREAAQAAIEALAPVLEGRDGDDPVPVLDLACGGWPVTISQVMAAFPDNRFTYTGIDINPDQVALAANEFPFPDNVTESRIIEGNAWELGELQLDAGYPVVFSGMNLHHGTPEEIWYLGWQLRDLLAPGGVFFSHDVYRPDHEFYRPRPDVIDGKTSWLVNPARLAWAEVPDIRIGRDTTAAEPAWRTDYVERMRRTLIERGGDRDGAESTARHMASRDYPVSTGEFGAVMASLGLDVSIQRYDDDDGPLGPYVACCTVTQPAEEAADQNR
jgi:SAM-dependent methyltransferase